VTGARGDEATWLMDDLRVEETRITTSRAEGTLPETRPFPRTGALLSMLRPAHNPRACPVPSDTERRQCDDAGATKP